MNEADFFGYSASFLVFATFYMKRMVPLRAAALEHTAPDRIAQTAAKGHRQRSFFEGRYIGPSDE